MNKDQTDSELIQNMISDDHASFALLVDRYRSLLYSIIKSRVKSEDDAKDILQEVFISFWNNRKKLVLRGPVAAYLSQAVRYAVIDWQLKHKRYINNIELLLPEAEALAADHHFMADELRARILALAGKLPLTVQTVFKLSRIEHKSNREIAEELNLSDKTVRNSLSIALQFLREQLGNTATLISLHLLLTQLFRK